MMRAKPNLKESWQEAFFNFGFLYFSESKEIGEPNSLMLFHFKPFLQSCYSCSLSILFATLGFLVLLSHRKSNYFDEVVVLK